MSRVLLYALFMSMYSTAPASILAPRVVAISPDLARATMATWVLRDGNPEDRKLSLQRSFVSLHATDLSSSAILAVKYGSRITTIAVLDRVEPETADLNLLKLWLLECDDTSSGTILMRSLVGTVGSRLCISSKLPEQWQIAFSYFMSGGLPGEL